MPLPLAPQKWGNITLQEYHSHLKIFFQGLWNLLASHPKLSVSYSERPSLKLIKSLRVRYMASCSDRCMITVGYGHINNHLHTSCSHIPHTHIGTHPPPDTHIHIYMNNFYNFFLKWANYVLLYPDNLLKKSSCKVTPYQVNAHFSGSEFYLTLMA